MMDFELPRSFVAVAECGGFHRAAAFGFARRSAHCASRKRIGPADRLIVYTSPSLTGVRAAALAGLAITPLPATAPTSCRKNLPKSPSGAHAHQIVAGRPLAPNAESGIEKAIEEFQITNPEQQKQLVATGQLDLSLRHNMRAFWQSMTSPPGSCTTARSKMARDRKIAGARNPAPRSGAH